MPELIPSRWANNRNESNLRAGSELCQPEKRKKMKNRQATPQSKSATRGNLARIRKPCFQASVTSDGELEVLIYENIGEDFWSGGGVTAKSVREAMAAAGDFSKISLRINSPGGDVFEGITI